MSIVERSDGEMDLEETVKVNKARLKEHYGGLAICVHENHFITEIYCFRKRVISSLKEKR